MVYDAHTDFTIQIRKYSKGALAELYIDTGCCMKPRQLCTKGGLYMNVRMRQIYSYLIFGSMRTKRYRWLRYLWRLAKAIMDNDPGLERPVMYSTRVYEGAFISLKGVSKLLYR